MPTEKPRYTVIVDKLEDISPSPEALALGEKTGKPPALVQLVLEESESSSATASRLTLRVWPKRSFWPT